MNMLKVRQSFGLLVALVAIFTVFFSTSVIKAQEPAVAVEITGAIQAMDTQSITINSQTIQITGAELNTALEIGKVIKIQGQMQAGQIIAREINLPGSNAGTLPPGEIELVGLISGYDGTNVTIGNMLINVATAQIEAGVQVGSIVKVHVSLNAVGEWVAREVLVNPASTGTLDNSNDNSANDNSNDNSVSDNSVNFAGGEVEIVGTLDAINGDNATVNGISFSLLGAEIKNTLIVGMTIKIHLSDVNGVMSAREIESYVPGLNDNGIDNSNDDNSNDDNGNDNAVVIPADCVAAQPTGWTTYTIQSGDTFSAIANGANIIMSDLAIANCIADPRIIVTGVTIFVPQTPVMNNNGSDDNTNSNDDNGNDDHGGNGSDDNSNDDNGNDDHGGNGSDDNGNDDNGNDDHGGDNKGGDNQNDNDD